MNILERFRGDRGQQPDPHVAAMFENVQHLIERQGVEPGVEDKPARAQEILDQSIPAGPSFATDAIEAVRRRRSEEKERELHNG